MQTLISATGSVTRLREVIAELDPSMVMLVTGRRSFSQSGAQELVLEALDSVPHVRFSDFDVNPRIEDVVRGAAIGRENAVDAILAVGGGSALDMAKMVKATIESPGTEHLVAVGRSPVAVGELPIIAVPTTAGSGSESTQFAVVYVEGKKYSVTDAGLVPDIAILDGQLIASNTDYQLAVNGLDALAQALESYWAVGSSADSQEWARTAIPMILDHLPAAIAGRAESDLQQLVEAANLAGRAINISKTTAPHAFSYAFTSAFGIPHGHAVWLTLPEVFQIHTEIDSSITAGLVELLRLEPGDYSGQLKRFLMSLGVEPEMAILGAGSVEVRRSLAGDVNLERLSNNPVELDERSIDRIFHLG